MNDNLYSLLRYKYTDGVQLKTIYADDESKSFKQTAEMVMADQNVEYIVDMIIGKSDPLRNGISVGQRDIIKVKVNQLLSSWKALGKFDQATVVSEGKTLFIRTVSPIALLDHYNKEFVDAFAEMILPMSDATKVTSVTNPNGLYAQQERIIQINSKPVPFYERALYRRLGDRNLEQRIDETENPFYRMDHNPRLPELEKKKRDVDRSSQPTYLDRQTPEYRMRPRY